MTRVADTALKAVFGQRLTFVGEQRPPSGSAAEVEVDVEHIKGYVAGMTVESGTLKARLHASDLAEGAERSALTSIVWAAPEADVPSPPPDTHIIVRRLNRWVA